MQKYSTVFLANWQYQPVHNVFLLIWSELGIIGLVLFILFLWKVFRANNTVPRLPADEAGGTPVFKAILLGLTIIMFFDHYFWDIQQGQIILWMILGLVVGSCVKNNN
jgi:O-antigen ligase